MVSSNNRGSGDEVQPMPIPLAPNPVITLLQFDSVTLIVSIGVPIHRLQEDTRELGVRIRSKQGGMRETGVCEI
jgi:hypothetical protein